jgi:hypothetical protein
MRFAEIRVEEDQKPPKCRDLGYDWAKKALRAVGGLQPLKSVVKPPGRS